jgi:hemerythrin
MALIEWTTALELGLPEIDAQHRRLVAITNDLDDAMRRGKGRYALSNILDALSSYTATHFQTEEGYFSRCAYPGAGDHVREHNDFVSRVYNFWLEFAGGRKDLSADMMDFLSGWLQQHIMIRDRKFVDYLKQSEAKDSVRHPAEAGEGAPEPPVAMRRAVA